MELLAKSSAEFAQILTPEALQFIEQLEREFGPRRRGLLNEQIKRRVEITRPTDRKMMINSSTD